MSADGLSRGVPAQHLAENQDPEVQFNLNEVTGQVTPLAAFLEVQAPKVKGKKRAASTETAEPAPSVAEEAPSDPGAGE